MNLDQGGYDLVKAACNALDVSLKLVKPNFPMLKGADATINVKRKWTLVNKAVPDEVKAFLIAHELGHLRLHPAASDTVEVNQDALTANGETSGARDVESYGARERQELQANVFAREFLLPRSIARQNFLEDNCSASTIAANTKLPLDLVRLQFYDAVLLPYVGIPTKVYRLPAGPTPAQEPAVNSDAKTTLVDAGPGTGKTTALLLRLRRLIGTGISPESIVILTFSNKAARELVERARAGNIPGSERVWIGTFHAFGLEFLRKFGNLHGLDSRFPVLDKLATVAMLEQDVTSADLKSFDPLSNPFPWLENAIDAIRRSKDEVFNAAQFAAAVVTATEDPELDAKRRDVATIFERYERLLSLRKSVDLTDLLCVSIRLMQSADPSVGAFLAGIQHLMVDEFQDVNRASALLVKALAPVKGTLWVVGDANQAIYAFMGASSSNLESFKVDFPDAIAIALMENHRSSQEIVDVFGSVAARNPTGRQTIVLNAALGQLGHGPRHVRTTDEEEQLRALAWRIRTLESEGTQLAEQALIVFQNAIAAEFAIGLEQLGIPVLYLGNIFERGEIKDLICLLQLAVDPHGVNLVRQWHSPLLDLSRLAADAVLAQVVSEDKSWREATEEAFTPKDIFALQNLRRMCALLNEGMSPWDALGALLLEDGTWLRDLASQRGQAAANSLMAVWQFVHFCRTPDGTGRWSTIKNLPQRIRDRVRMNEDRSMRAVPPEAEGMNAVRILTAHGSKGLEFDAVHFLGVTKRTYEEPTPKSNKLVPDAVLDGAKVRDILKNERHNLLYVAVSRPRFHLTVYTTADQVLPSSLDGLLEPLVSVWPQTEDGAATAPSSRKPSPIEVSMEEYLQFTKCPQRHEMSVRAGRSLREELKVYRAIDVATRKAVQILAGDKSLLDDGQWPGVVRSALTTLGLQEHSAAAIIRDKVEQRVKRGRDLLREGGANTEGVAMKIGPLKVVLKPDQVFQDGKVRRLRFIRTNESNFTSMKQPLAALLDAHHQGGGDKMTIEVATLSDGNTSSVGTIRPPTRPKYEAIAIRLCSQYFPAEPANDRSCHTCAYMFPCNKRVSG